MISEGEKRNTVNKQGIGEKRRGNHILLKYVEHSVSSHFVTD